MGRAALLVAHLYLLLGGAQCTRKHGLSMVAGSQPHQVRTLRLPCCSCAQRLQPRAQSGRRSVVQTRQLASRCSMFGPLPSCCQSGHRTPDHRTFLIYSPPSHAPLSHHEQGVVLDCSPLEFEPLPSVPDAPEAPAAAGRLPVWLCLDEVMDPVSLAS